MRKTMRRQERRLWRSKPRLSDEEERSKARGKFLACLFLAGSDRERYKSVVDDLGNDFTLGKPNYPEDVASMLNLLTNRRGIGGNKSRQVEDL
jgi:hypothetical protein